MTQGVLWHDSVYDALGADVAAAGGIKKLAGALYPTLDDSTAATKLRNALNPDQPHKLCAEEITHVMRLARAAGSQATMDYLARELGFEVKAIEPRDELQVALANFDSRADQIMRAISAVQRAKERL